MARLAICRTAVLLALFVSASAGAFSIAPTSVILEGRDPEPVKIRIEASPSTALALDLSVIERRGSGPNELLEPPLPAALHVDPPQLLIPAGETADVTLRWTGEPAGEASRSFYLVADELPIAFAEDGTRQGLRILARVHLPVHRSNGGKPDLQARIVAVNGKNGVEIVNRGSRYTRFSHLSLRVGGPFPASGRTIPGADLARLAGSDALLPNRIVWMPMDQLGLDGEVTALELVPVEQK